MACNGFQQSSSTYSYLAALLLTISIFCSTSISASPVRDLFTRDALPVCQATYGKPIYSDCQTALGYLPHDQNPDPAFATPLWFVNRNPMDTDVMMIRPLVYAYRSCSIRLELVHNQDDHETWYNIARMTSQIISTCVNGAENFGGTKPAGRGGNIAITVTGPQRCKSPTTGQVLSGASCPNTPDIQAQNRIVRQCSSPGDYCKTSPPSTSTGFKCTTLDVKVPGLLFGALSSILSSAGSCVVA